MSSSLFSRIWQGAVIGFQAAKAEVDQIKAKLATVPGVKQLEDDVQSSIEQQLSNALAFASSELATGAPDVISMAESAVDSWIMVVTHGAAAPAMPGLNALLTLGEQQLVAVIQHGFAEARVKLNLPAPTSNAAPTVDGLATGIVTTAVQGAGILATPQH